MMYISTSCTEDQFLIDIVCKRNYSVVRMKFPTKCQLSYNLYFRLENFAHMNEKSWNIGEQRELLSDVIGLISALVLHYGDQKIEETRKHEDADALRDVS